MDKEFIESSAGQKLRPVVLSLYGVREGVIKTNVGDRYED
jgi:hypothetical protein